MKAIDTKLTTHRIGPVKNWDSDKYGPCDVLSIVRFDGAIYTYWKPSIKELLYLLLGRKVRVTLLTPMVPPIAVEVVKDL